MGLIQKDKHSDGLEQEFHVNEIIEGYRTNDLNGLLEKISLIIKWFGQDVDETYVDIMELQVNSNKLSAYLTELGFFESFFYENQRRTKFLYDVKHASLKEEKMKEKWSGVKANNYADQHTHDLKQEKTNAEIQHNTCNTIRYQGSKMLDRMNQHISLLKHN